MKRMLGVASAVALCALGAQAQTTVYKCSSSAYSEQPCSRRIVRTYENPADPAPNARTGELVAHRLPGETADELALRRRRIHLSESDRDECARLDKKIPFEQQRMRDSVRPDEVEEAQESINAAKKRFSRLRC